MNSLEQLFYEVAKLFMTPVLLVLAAMFAHALWVLGGLLFDLQARLRNQSTPRPLENYLTRHPDASQEQLELQLLKQTESLRITSRVAPMLGLVATMIPMGPALLALGRGDSMGMAENLVVAFAAVIIALLAASMTYVTLLVRRRWLLQELSALLDRPRSTQGVKHG
ncbi:MAG TPA: MotA/TolQ/ExbB proton channel family protein [Guyparkeria sp.]|nr:MotA/TolQ/ExbB proton channel family protein [Guyparkeria sp.]